VTRKRRRRPRPPVGPGNAPDPAEDGADAEEVDLGDHLGLALRDRAALAPNWRSPLRLDLCIGIGVALLGVSMLAGGRPVLGALLVAAGLAYDVLVLRRWRSWAAIRRRAGLDA
jgi:hypothetical protein